MPSSGRRHCAPVTVRQPDPRVWRHALDLADGDHRRLQLLADGSVLVRNPQFGK